MKIVRSEFEQRAVVFSDCKVYVRKNFAVASADEWYYEYVKENSYLALTELLPPEDAAILQEGMETLIEPIEIYTRLDNRRNEGYRNVYLRLENCDKTEEGEHLYLVNILDIVDMERRTRKLDGVISKYRHFMTLKNEYYFDYFISKDRLVIYKYIDEISVTVYESSLEQFRQNCENNGQTEEQKRQIEDFCTYLEKRTHRFEVEFTMNNEDGTAKCLARGGTFLRNDDIIAGVFSPDQAAVQETYYLTAAAKDVGTGLFNKKAATEYAVEKLSLAKGAVCWLLIIDIDDFKSVNDSFGHLFGDQVIYKVADTLRHHVSLRGIVGRFGGDEFFILLDKVKTREDVKTLLKSIVKELAVAYDPKLKVTLSIGISQYPKDGTDFAELFGKADKALYIAKEKGKNRHIIYEEEKHGAYHKDGIQAQTVAYVVSREKRREALRNIIGNIYKQGAEYVTDRPEVQKNIRDLFDLDGFTVYTNYGRDVLCRNGSYSCETPDTNGELTEESYQELFGREDVLIVNNMTSFKTKHPEFYKLAKKQEITATIRCLVRKEGVPFAMIHFDVFNRNRKWSDMDIEMLSLIGCCLGGIICGQ
ncbi:MAG: GGDEF domain-containing protein [Lachnoclostridium sp.]|nr:GGDEF domain-containing protein [Lachnospira sp.]MCM1248484.1 GGDEF domain-containing protein [Lachnoclostridium sp.]MCM1536492.1 GGDEF domain-containing protein [Clostridium sp.]